MKKNMSKLVFTPKPLEMLLESMDFIAAFQEKEL